MYRHVAFRPVVFVQSIKVDREAIRSIAKSWLHLQPVDGALSSRLAGVNANKADAFFPVAMNVEVLNDK